MGDEWVGDCAGCGVVEYALGLGGEGCADKEEEGDGRTCWW